MRQTTRLLIVGLMVTVVAFEARPARADDSDGEIVPHVRSANPTEAGLLRDLRRSRIRRRIWITMAAAQAVYLIAIVLWPH